MLCRTGGDSSAVVDVDGDINKLNLTMTAPGTVTVKTIVSDAHVDVKKDAKVNLFFASPDSSSLTGTSESTICYNQGVCTIPDNSGGLKGCDMCNATLSPTPSPPEEEKVSSCWHWHCAHRKRLRVSFTVHSGIGLYPVASSTGRI